MQLFKVYSLTDERVKEIAQTCWAEHTEVLIEVYTHYSIEHNSFCNEDDDDQQPCDVAWCDNYIICDYDKDCLK